MASKELKDLLKALRAAGWRVEDSRHFRCFPPDVTKPIVVIAKTPSDRRTWQNMLALLRRSGFDTKEW